VSLLSSFVGQIGEDLDQWRAAGLVASGGWPVQAHRTLTWANRTTGTQFQGTYSDTYAALLNDKQYTALLEDGALLQVFLVLSDKDAIVEGKYAYYPPPDRGQTAVRIDWSPKQEEESPVDHSRIHMQFTALEELRLPGVVLPRPALFVDSLARRLYKEAWYRRYPEAAKLLAPPNLNTVGTPLDAKMRESFLRASDYGRFLDAQRLLGPLAISATSWFDGTGIHFSCGMPSSMNAA
jgi:hypothetical protein